MTNLLTGLWNWVDERLPVQRAWDTHMGKYYAPKNFNIWYFFGVFALLVLVNQLLTGIWLVMIYVPTAEDAFASVEYCMRDVAYCGIIRLMHAVGASFFFIVVYLHMFRALLYGSYKAPRELVWIFGMIMYVALMAEAFLGYVLPWGQMSYWGAQVIVSLFGAVPYVGEDLVQWIRGDYLISEITLNRFYALHIVAIPIVLLALVVLHILALHQVGSNNPDGIDIKKNKGPDGVPLDGIAFHPYYTVHDLVGISAFLIAFSVVIFYFPEMNGYFLEFANFEQANNLKTPEHIAPVWYFTPFYAILRAVTIDLGGVFTAKLLGFLAMIGAIVILFFMPWLDKSPVRSIRYKGWLPKIMLLLFAAIFVVLGYLGVKAPTESRTLLAQVGTLFYFVFFITMPIWTNPQSPRVKSLLNYAICGSLALGLLWIAFLGQFFDALLAADDAKVVWPFLGGEHKGSRIDDPINWFVRSFGIALGILVLLLPTLTSKDSIGEEPERVQMKGLPRGLVLLGLLFFIVMTVAPIKAVAAGGAFDCGSIPCDEFKADLKNQPSLQSGAKWYMNYCMGCHSLQYSRYQRVADDLGIPVDIMMDNLVFSDQKIGDLMDNAMPSDRSKSWFGVAPPDLSLVARSRSPEWLYTYLRNFYKDDSRPLGVNNRVFANVGMPHVLAGLQGLPECGPGSKLDSHGKVLRNELGEPILDEICGSLLKGSTEGTMTAAEYDNTIYDLVNFLEYVADPGVLERHRIGIFVILFLIVLLVLTALLNREYWRGIH
ncbi:MAG: ubiquinol-cytochrome c reductase cytochrome b subunit [Cellvibrionaceae bacterium]|jgi:ubiquinol-cytochrome c reductase cytochrome b subunit